MTEQEPRTSVHEVCEALQEAALEFPSLRAGQLIDNAMAQDGFASDLYQISNEELVKRLRSYASEMAGDA